MRILMTTDTVGGVWHYALELCRALAPYEVQIDLPTLGADLSADQRRAAAEIPCITLHESRYRLCWMDDPWEDVRRAGDWLLGLAERLRPRLVHLNDYPHGALPWPAPVLMVGHSCVLSWWEAVHGRPAPGSWDRYRREVRRGLQGAAEVVAPSAAMLAALERHYGPLPRRRVIFNGRRPGAFRPAAKAPFILACGRLWDEAKNIRALAEAAPQLPWPVYIAGDTRHPDGGEAAFPAVTLLGRLAADELAGWLRRAAIYALPARYEPFGLSILEAALSGCALVLGDIPSLREIWQDTALFVPPDDPQALAAVLDRLIQDAGLRARYARRAREHAGTLSADAMAAGYWAAYRALVH